MFKIAVLASGGGSNLGAILNSIDKGEINVSVEAVITDKAGVYAIERAKERKIKHYVFDKKIYGKEISQKIYELLKDKVDLIVLAGYLSILHGDILREFRDRIINIHPSLIPSFSGPGMYGIKVHEAAIRKGVKFSGCTVHFVNEEVDGGEILLQAVVPVLPGDDAKALQERVLKEEHKLLPYAVKLISEGKVKIENGKARILEEASI